LKIIADSDAPVTWEEITRNMWGDCENAAMYVDRVFSLSQ
jgi:hypothetical protein